MSENTGELLSPRHRSNPPSTASWYLADGSKPVGPFSIQDVLEGIQAGRVSWIQYAWKQGMPQWQRLCDLEDFQPHTAKAPPIPSPQSSKTQGTKPSSIDSLKARSAALPTSSEPAASTPEPQKQTIERKWFLHYSNTQFGPFSVDEIHRYLRIGKLNGRVHAWREGMPHWERLERLGLFDEVLSEISGGALGSKSAPSELEPAAAAKPEQRKGPRRALLAKILHANSAEVGIAMCRDISVGGMQVLTDQLPGPQGTRVRLNITPMKGSISPFVAEGRVVRILEDQRGFCIRFEKLSNEARQGIETYLEEEET